MSSKEVFDIILISSPGGHSVQLEMLKKAFEQFSTHKVYVTSNGLNNTILDCNSKTPLKVVITFFQLLRLFSKTRARMIISTGAAPGAVAILIARLYGMKTIWIDSVANYEKVSKSCNLIKYISTYTYTQWEHLRSKKVGYIGSLL